MIHTLKLLPSFLWRTPTADWPCSQEDLGGQTIVTHLKHKIFMEFSFYPIWVCCCCCCFASIPEYINICFKIKNVYHLTKSFLQENTPCLSCCLCTACTPGSGSSPVWGIGRTLGWGWMYLDSPIFGHKFAVLPWENHLKLLFSISFVLTRRDEWSDWIIYKVPSSCHSVMIRNLECQTHDPTGPKWLHIIDRKIQFLQLATPFLFTTSWLQYRFFWLLNA